MSKKKYIAKLTTDFLTEDVIKSLEENEIEIITYSKLLNLIIVESEINLIENQPDFLIDIEEDKEIPKP